MIKDERFWRGKIIKMAVGETLTATSRDDGELIRRLASAFGIKMSVKIEKYSRENRFTVTRLP